ncbi:hypothetical protein L2735_01825 [Shewanella olleyana]|uniref:hypothetical protein n=1 Tax=Shewanella olleyana TaxID=135626 RepID=UPI002010C2D6|nr:hypothetical protein [Shewanella olleyana]MCL1065554.1 hypothetical protein [Shewanella olleyana]
MKKALIALGVICLTFTATIRSEEAAPLALKVGFWEGIGIDTFSYELLQINPNGKHRAYTLGIHGGFQSYQLNGFDNSDISCNNSECTITMPKPIRNEFTHLIITPLTKERYNVIEIVTDKDQKHIFSRKYELQKQSGRSTPRQFIAKNKQRLQSISSYDDKEINGFWTGVMTNTDSSSLISFDIDPNSSSQLVRYINGTQFNFSLDFAPGDIETLGKLTTIETISSESTTKIVMEQIVPNALEGVIYSDNFMGSFKLYRVKAPKSD